MDSHMNWMLRILGSFLQRVTFQHKHATNLIWSSRLKRLENLSCREEISNHPALPRLISWVPNPSKGPKRTSIFLRSPWRRCSQTVDIIDHQIFWSQQFIYMCTLDKLAPFPPMSPQSRNCNSSLFDFSTQARFKAGLPAPVWSRFFDFVKTSSSGVLIISIEFEVSQTGTEPVV